MERLTEYESIAGHAHAIPIVSDMDVIMMRLAAYEDTGLTPEEVAALVKDWSDLCTIVGECGGIDRLRELVEADKNGRVVVLPCKVGDTVYMISWRLNGRHEIEERVFSLTYFDPAKYGKDYFLSREEAEKALEAWKDG
jgi:hypothetical protein